MFLSDVDLAVGIPLKDQNSLPQMASSKASVVDHRHLALPQGPSSDNAASTRIPRTSSRFSEICEYVTDEFAKRLVNPSLVCVCVWSVE